MRNNSADALRRVDDLIERSDVRSALHGPEVLRELPPVKLSDGALSAEIIADLRGYDRGY